MARRRRSLAFFELWSTIVRILGVCALLFVSFAHAKFRKSQELREQYRLPFPGKHSEVLA
jgi:hypothetical protein